jgi:hypothetical protein
LGGGWGKPGILSIKSLSTYFFGETELQHGLTHVAFSRILAIGQMLAGFMEIPLPEEPWSLYIHNI